MSDVRLLLLLVPVLTLRVARCRCGREQTRWESSLDKVGSWARRSGSDSMERTRKRRKRAGGGAEGKE
eukprot:253778-Hanusia_phi.AAC.2